MSNLVNRTQQDTGNMRKFLEIREKLTTRGGQKSSEFNSATLLREHG